MDSFFSFFPNFNFLIIQSLAIVLTALLLPNLKVTSIFGPILAVIVMGWINNFYWDNALFFHIPESLSIQTLVLILANGMIFWIVVKILPGIEIKGVLPAIVAPIIWSISSIITNKYFKEIDWQRVLEFIKSLFSLLKTFITTST